MSVRRYVWDIKLTRDFLRTFVKPQVGKNNLYFTLIYLLLNCPKFVISNVKIIS